MKERDDGQEMGEREREEGRKERSAAVDFQGKPSADFRIRTSRVCELKKRTKLSREEKRACL